jgi:hypothetical protein
MASIRKDILIDSPAADVWAAVADTGAVHQRLARGFVTDTQVDGDTRIVTFVTGAVARELLVDIDEQMCRVAYAVVDSPLGLRHHHATMEVVEDGARQCRLVWIADLAPDSAAPTVEGMMAQGALAMQHSLAAVSR